MRLSGLCCKFKVAIYAKILVLLCAFSLITNAQDYGFAINKSSIKNQFESAVIAEDMESVYILGYKLAAEFNANRQFDSTATIYNRMALIAKKLNRDSLNFSTKHTEAFVNLLHQNIKINEIEGINYKGQKEDNFLSSNNNQYSTISQLKNQDFSLKLIILGLTILGLITFYIYKLNNSIKVKNSDLKLAQFEKDILLREIHHRVKNNLQVISSLLALQSKYIKDDNALNAIKQGQDRVYSMALIHQDLYQSDNLKGVDSKNYFEHLIDNLFESYNIDEENIVLNYNVDSIILDVDTMIPLGLVMNELVSNALKHAFKNQEIGKINVDLKKSKDCLTLKVSDNGMGLNNINDLDGKSFGYELIKAFARKLKADIKIESKEGLSIELKIKNYTTAA